MWVVRGGAGSSRHGGGAARLETANAANAAKATSTFPADLGDPSRGGNMLTPVPSAEGVEVDPVKQLEHDVAVRSEVGALRFAFDLHQRDRPISPDLDSMPSTAPAPSSRQ